MGFASWESRGKSGKSGTGYDFLTTCYSRSRGIAENCGFFPGATLGFPAGNLAKDKISRTMAYDSESRMTAFTGTGTTNYAYDGQGRRVRRSGATLPSAVLLPAGLGRPCPRPSSSTLQIDRARPLDP